MSSNQQVKVYKASDALQKKAGTGVVGADKVRQAENAIKNNDVDFYSEAKQNLDDLKKAIDDAKNGISNSKEALLKSISAPLSQLKSSAPLFEFNLVGVLADIMFNFIQRIDNVDARAIKIIVAHHTTLNAIICNNMKGDGGAHGAQLKKELVDVCDKYFKVK